MIVNFDIGTKEACLVLIEKIANSSAIKKQLIDGNLAASLISCTHILDLRQIQIATYKANLANTRGKMTTRNVYSEILYQLTPNRQITQAFKLFGIQDTDTGCVAVTIGETREADMQKVIDLVSSAGAVCLPFEDIHKFHSLPSIKKIYKIQEPELEVGTLSEAVVGRIAAKEIIS